MAIQELALHIHYTGQETRARTQMLCHVTLLLFCSRMHLSPMPVTDCAIDYCSDGRAIAKSWDDHLRMRRRKNPELFPVILYYKRMSYQKMEKSMGDSPHLFSPTKFALQLDTDYYVLEITRRISQAWSLAGNAVKKQTQQHDVHARSAKVSVCWLYACHVYSTAYKLERPYHSPYSVVQVVENVVEVRPVDKPHSTTTFVALKWVRICPEEMSNEIYNSNGRLSLVI